MKDSIDIMHAHIAGQLESEAASAFLRDLENDGRLKSEWIDLLIEQYLAGELETAWREHVEMLINSDDNVRMKLEFQQKVIQDFKFLIEEKTKSEVELLLPKIRKESNSILKLKWLFPLAAVAAVALLAYFILPGSSDHINAKQLFATYFEPYDMILTQRDGNILNKTLEEATKAYQNGDYLIAFEKFEDLQKAKQGDPLINLYTGICALSINETEKAMIAFESILDHPELIEHAQWYLALSYLKAGETNKAKSVLEELDLDNTFYDSKVTELLQQL